MHSKNDGYQFLNLALDDAYVYYSLAFDPNASIRIICFHSKQAIEKSLKAILVSEGIAPIRTHDLTELVHMPEDAIFSDRQKGN
jgi:hypothetical protein